MKYIIALNAPPNAGKDTVAEILVSTYEFRHLTYKELLYEMTANHYNIPLHKFMEVHNDRNLKDSYRFPNGMTTREMLIYASEHEFKPKLGLDFLSKAVIKKLPDVVGDIVISDLGFEVELADLKQYQLENPDTKVILLHIIRDGCNYDNDSRSHQQDDKIVTYEIYNNGSLYDLQLKVKNILINQIKKDKNNGKS